MIDRRIGKIKIRRGTDQERKTIVFSEAELLYTTDTKRMFVGDGTTNGGVLISNKNFIVTSMEFLPSNIAYCDIIHNISDSTTYIVGSASNGSLSAILICDVECCKKLQKDIEEIKIGIDEVIGLVDELNPNQIPTTNNLPTTNVIEEFKFVIQPTDQYVNYAGTATFTASAVGPGDITYQWYGNTNQLIVGAITNTLTIPNVDIPNIGSYKCVATSSKLGSLNSNLANLFVGSDFILSNPDNLFVLSNPDMGYIKWNYSSDTNRIILSPNNEYLITNVGDYFTWKK